MGIFEIVCGSSKTLQNKSLSRIGFEKAEIEPNKVVIYLKFLIPEMLKYESMP